MPDDLQNVIDIITEKHPSFKINSCLVTLYKDGDDHIPPHVDNEKCIDPESDIVTVSLGAKRSMTFISQFGDGQKSVELLNGSIICSSRKSMEYWKHAILPDKSVSSPRISLTLRHIAPYFENSTIVLGDSNTKFFRFGESTQENPTFGRWLPGKRLRVTKIKNLPPVENIAPYQNIVIHSGINDLLDEIPPAPTQIVHYLEHRCAQIHYISPSTKIIISPILPTKNANLNQKVNAVNHLLHQLCDKHPNLELLRYPNHVFAGNSGLLKPEMGRYDRSKNGALESDLVHLGSKGLRAFRWFIKSHIVRPRNNVNRFELHDHTARNTLHNQPRTLVK